MPTLIDTRGLLRPHSLPHLDLTRRQQHHHHHPPIHDFPHLPRRIADAPSHTNTAFLSQIPNKPSEALQADMDVHYSASFVSNFSLSIIHIAGFGLDRCSGKGRLKHSSHLFLAFFWRGHRGKGGPRGAYGQYKSKVLGLVFASIPKGGIEAGGRRAVLSQKVLQMRRNESI